MTVRASNLRSTRGFTLIELVIVIAVIAILAALLVPTILGQAERARISRAAGEVNEIGKGLARLRTDTAVTGLNMYSKCLIISNLMQAPTAGTADGQCNYPNANGSVLAACNTVTAGTPCFGGPYMASVPNRDPWNQNYHVTIDNTSGKITVHSLGPDGSINSPDDANLKKDF